MPSATERRQISDALKKRGKRLDDLEARLRLLIAERLRAEQKEVGDA